ncbi:MAG: hypothetical protein LBR89_04445 [Holosporales bacterium]|jgi:F0F1-type ATP synthase epsilon subunit|nr:hypothetical protein [Holosporales bacterium]
MPFTLNIHSWKVDAQQVDDVVSLAFFSSLGCHEILQNHEPIFTTVSPNLLKYRCKDGEPKEVQLPEGGFLKFDSAQCDVWIK